MRITKNQLIGLLSNNRGAEVITMMAITEPDMVTKSNPWYGIVEAVSRVNGIVNWNYEDAVNRQRIREGLEPDFQALPRRWGQKVEGTPFVTHRGRTYLEIKIERIQELWYRNIMTKDVLQDDLIEPWLRESKTRQEVEKEVILRDFAVDNIILVRFRGQVYTLY